MKCFICGGRPEDHESGACMYVRAPHPMNLIPAMIKKVESVRTRWWERDEAEAIKYAQETIDAIKETYKHNPILKVAGKNLHMEDQRDPREQMQGSREMTPEEKAFKRWNEHSRRELGIDKFIGQERERAFSAGYDAGQADLREDARKIASVPMPDKPMCDPSEIKPKLFP